MINKKKFRILTSFLIILLFIFTLWFLVRGTNDYRYADLPSSFSIEFSGDLSSSGSDREYEGNLVFLNNEAINGFQYYLASGHKIKCLYKDKHWVDLETTKNCPLEYLPTTKFEIEQKIKSGKFKPLEDCRHYSICYKVLK